MMITTEQFELIVRVAKAYADVYKKHSHGTLVTMMCRAYGLGLPFTEGPEIFQIVSGKLALSANGQATLMRRAGYSWTVDTLTDERVALTVFASDGKKLGESVFTMEDAKKARLTGDNWEKYPRNMMMARALSNAVKWFAPDATGGAALYTADELGDDSVEAIDIIEDTEPDDPPPPANVVEMPDDAPPVAIEKANSKSRNEDKPITTEMAQNIAIKFDELCGNKKEGKLYRQYALSMMTNRKIESANDLTISEGRLALHLLGAEKIGRDKVGNYTDWSLLRDYVVSVCYLSEADRNNDYATLDVWAFTRDALPDEFETAKEFVAFMRSWKFDSTWKEHLTELQALQDAQEKAS